MIPSMLIQYCFNGHMSVLIYNHMTLNENGRGGSSDNDVDLSSLPIFPSSLPIFPSMQNGFMNENNVE